MKILAYARVSTKGQRFDAQLADLQKFGYDQLFTEKVSGRVFKRVVLDNLIEKLSAGDVLVVWKIDRLGRSLDNVFRLYLELKEKGVAIVSIRDGIDTREPLGDIFLAFLSKIAESDFFSIKERQRAGIDARRSKDLPMGRPVGLSKDNEVKAELAKRLFVEDKLSISEIMRKINVNSRTTIYKYLRYKGVKI